MNQTEQESDTANDPDKPYYQSVLLFLDALYKHVRSENNNENETEVDEADIKNEFETEGDEAENNEYETEGHHVENNNECETDRAQDDATEYHSISYGSPRHELRYSVLETPNSYSALDCHQHQIQHENGEESDIERFHDAISYLSEKCKAGFIVSEAENLRELQNCMKLHGKGLRKESETDRPYRQYGSSEGNRLSIINHKLDDILRNIQEKSQCQRSSKRPSDSNKFKPAPDTMRCRDKSIWKNMLLVLDGLYEHVQCLKDESEKETDDEIEYNDKSKSSRDSTDTDQLMSPKPSSDSTHYKQKLKPKCSKHSIKDRQQGSTKRSIDSFNNDRQLPTRCSTDSTDFKQHVSPNRPNDSKPNGVALKVSNDSKKHGQATRPIRSDCYDPTMYEQPVQCHCSTNTSYFEYPNRTEKIAFLMLMIFLCAFILAYVYLTLTSKRKTENLYLERQLQNEDHYNKIGDWIEENNMCPVVNGWIEQNNILCHTNTHNVDKQRDIQKTHYETHCQQCMHDSQIPYTSKKINHNVLERPHCRIIPSLGETCHNDRRRVVTNG